MFRSALLVARIDLVRHLREVETYVLLLVLPLVFTGLLGTLSQGYHASLNGVGASLTLVCEVDELTPRLVEELERRGYRVERSTDWADGMTDRRAVRVRRGTNATEPVAVDFRGRDASVRQGREDARIAAAVLSALKRDAEPRFVRWSVTPWGGVAPRGYAQTVPGTLTMFVLMVQLTIGAALVAQDREQGTLRRLLCSPVSGLEIVLGKWVGKVALGVPQVLAALLTAELLLATPMGNQAAAIVVTLIGWLAFSAAVSVLLGWCCGERARTLPIGVAIALSLAALGGCWWPAEITPAWMQEVQRALPTGWVRNALVDLYSGRPSEPSAVILAVRLLAGTAMALGLAVFWVGRDSCRSR